MPTDVRPQIYKPGKHESQPKGHGIGVPKNPVADLPKGGGAGPHESQPQGHSLGIPQCGPSTKSTGASSPSSGGGIFKTRGKVLCNSGVAGAHRIGSRKK